MPARTITPTPKTYAQLRDGVIAVVVTGRVAIDRAWVDTCRETSRLINEHGLLFRNRANYGARVYEKLSEDTQVSACNLRELKGPSFSAIFQFGAIAPNWAGPRAGCFCPVPDETARLKLLKRAVKKDWTVPEHETLARSINAIALAPDDPAPAPLVELLPARGGTRGLRRVVERVDGP